MKHDAAYAAICKRHSNIPQDPLPLGDLDGGDTEAPSAGDVRGLPASEVRALAEPVERSAEQVGGS